MSGILDPYEPREQVALPDEGPAYRQVVTIDSMHDSQPRDYADHERVQHVTIRDYNYNGKLADPAVDLTGDAEIDKVELDRQDRLIREAVDALGYENYKVSAEVAEQLRANRWVHYEPVEHSHATMEEHFQSFVDRIILVGPYTVEVTVITPFTD